MTDLTAFIAGLPKAELHVHHVGSASPRIVAELAARHAGAPRCPPTRRRSPTTSPSPTSRTSSRSTCRVVDLIRDAEDVRLLTYEVARDMARAAGPLRRADRHPVLLVRRGIAARAFCEAIEDARQARPRRELGVVLRWCFDIPGEAGLAAAEETAAARAATCAPEGLVSFGLGGPEIGVPRPQFKPYFDRARAAGLHSVPHAGETTGPRDDLGRAARPRRRADRPRHSARRRTRSCSAHLAEHRIPLEVCPTSNVAHPRGAVARRAPARGAGRGRACW